MKTGTTSNNLFQRYLNLNKTAFDAKERDIRAHESAFNLVQKDIDALNNKDIYFNPVLDRAYAGQGVFRFTVPAYTVERQRTIFYSLINRGYEETSDSTPELRILKRDSVYFIISVNPIKPTKPTKG